MSQNITCNYLYKTKNKTLGKFYFYRNPYISMVLSIYVRKRSKKVKFSIELLLLGGIILFG